MLKKMSTLGLLLLFTVFLSFCSKASTPSAGNNGGGSTKPKTDYEKDLESLKQVPESILKATIFLYVSINDGGDTEQKLKTEEEFNKGFASVPASSVNRSIFLAYPCVTDSSKYKKTSYDFYTAEGKKITSIAVTFDTTLDDHRMDLMSSDPTIGLSDPAMFTNYFVGKTVQLLLKFDNDGVPSYTKLPSITVRA